MRRALTVLVAVTGTVTLAWSEERQTAVPGSPSHAQSRPPEASVTTLSDRAQPGPSATPGSADDGFSGSKGRRFEVVARTGLHRDAATIAATVGQLLQGERVTYVDFIDRRLRIFDILVFDGGHWIKVQTIRGRVGWVPADLLREVQ